MSSFKFLEAFCGDTKRRLDRPFSAGKWSYATDGVIALRIPRVPEIKERTVAEMEALEFPGLPIAAALTYPVPELPAREWEYCAECREYAGGVPNPNCEECRGTNRTEKAIAIRLPGETRHASSIYLRKMRMFLRDARIIRGGQLPSNSMDVIRFVFEGGGSGILAAFRKD